MRAAAEGERPDRAAWLLLHALPGDGERAFLRCALLDGTDAVGCGGAGGDRLLMDSA